MMASRPLLSQIPVLFTIITVDVMPIPSADGANIMQFTYDGGSAITLNQNISGEQEFVFTEGSLFVTLDGIRFEPNRNLDFRGRHC